MRNDSFENIIKNKINDVEIVPPQIVWDNIDNQINQSKRIKKIIIASITTIAASVIIALSFNFLVTNSGIRIEQIDLASSINKTLIDIDYKNNSIITKPYNTLQLIPKGQFIIHNKINNPLERLCITSNTTHKFITCALNIKQEKQDRIAYNNDKVIISNNIENEKKVIYKTIIGMNLSTSSSLSNSQSASTMPLMGLRTSEVAPTSFTNNIDLPTSDIKLHTNLSINLELPIRKNLSLVSGLGYLGFTSKSNKGFYQGDINDIFTNEIIMNKYNSDIKDVKHYFSYLEVPLMMKYSMINNKISVYLNGGLGINFLVSNRSEIILDNDESIHNRTKDIKNITYCGIGGLGISTRIFSSFYIKAELQCRYYLKDISSNKALAIDKGMTNMSFGLSYKL